jgi:aspartyl protease family protein
MMMRPAGVVGLATLAALIAAGGVLRLSAHELDGKGRVAKAADGHYWADAEVDGSTVHFLVDTGSSAVTLSPADAKRLGLNLATLSYDRRVATAAGVEKAAVVTLGHIAVAGARVDRVQALIMKDPLPTSLLGMSYLGRLSSFAATPADLVLSR